MKNLTLNYDQLTAVKHASNLQALDAFKKAAQRKGVLPSAPWEAVLKLFIEWKHECEAIAGQMDTDEYMADVDNCIKEANAIINN